MTDEGTQSPRDEQSSESADDDGAKWPEQLLMATSAVFTIGLFAFVLWQASTTPVTAEPTAAVTGTEALIGGEVKVTVTFRNEQDVGLVMATVEVDCDSPPPELTFEHVPASDRRTGYVICPPGTQTPTATVSTWTEA